MIQRSIVRLLQLFPAHGIIQADVDEFNQQTKIEMDNIRDFIILHYKVTDREDSRFWRYCKNMPIPASLQHRIDMFSQSGKVYKYGNELFGESSWIQVMMGQGLMPKEYHPIVDLMEPAELQSFLNNIKATVKRKVDTLPAHNDFVQHYCKSTAM
jgi:tryptophan halogenase